MHTKGWKPDQAIQEKFTELRDSPTSNLIGNALRAVETNLRKKGAQARIESSPVISMDNGKPTQERAHANAVLQTAAAELSALPLLTRWILDPGSNCHVTNTKDASWNTTKKGGSLDVVYAGGALVQVEEWGETSIQVKTPTGVGYIKLT